jgi:hypothetical protein
MPRDSKSSRNLRSGPVSLARFALITLEVDANRGTGARPSRMYSRFPTAVIVRVKLPRAGLIHRAARAGHHAN